MKDGTAIDYSPRLPWTLEAVRIVRWLLVWHLRSTWMQECTCLLWDLRVRSSPVLWYVHKIQRLQTDTHTHIHCTNAGQKPCQTHASQVILSQTMNKRA